LEVDDQSGDGDGEDGVAEEQARSYSIPSALTRERQRLDRRW
jgi:hypothetical protein